MNDFLQQLEDDLDIFINPNEFAFDITYEAVKDVQSLTIPAILDTPFSTDGTGTIIMQSLQPTIRIKEHDLPTKAVRPGDYVTITGKEYWCKDSQPDGVGTIIIELKVK